MRALVAIIGRIFLCAIFAMSALGNKIPKFNDVVEIMRAQHVPAPNIMLIGAIVFLLVGSLSVVVGFKARYGATLLLIFLMLATFFFHDFWTISEDIFWVHSQNPEMKQPIQMVETIAFMKNLSLMGAMLLIIANGAGRGSIDNLLGSG